MCVGTDSLASTDSLSLLGELRRLQACEPGLSAEDLLHTITLAPARALQKEGELGCLKAGAMADMIAIPFEGALEQAAGACVSFTGLVPWMMVHGKVLPFSPL